MGHPNTQNLQPLNTKSKEEARRIGRLGGLSRSPKKKLGAQIREMKKRGTNNADITKLINIMENPDASILDIRELLDNWRGREKDISEATKLAKAYTDLHKAHHGEKHKVESNHNFIEPIKIVIMSSHNNKSPDTTSSESENKDETSSDSNAEQ